MSKISSSAPAQQRSDGGNSIHFWINGKPFTVGGEYDVRTTLNEFIRDGAGLKGTKVMCHEGGCGCCTVTVTITDHVTKTDRTFSINSCLCPLYSVDGWQITTVEGLGSKKNGFHPIQDRVAKHNATQCGYCTPGIVMNMYGLLQENARPTQQEVEDHFAGNLCRCTGYRPILDAMKSFASDSAVGGSIDIEDLNKHLFKCSGHGCKEASEGEDTATESCPGLHIEIQGIHWYQPHCLKTFQSIMQENGSRKIKLISGNTATGIFKDDGPFDVYINLCDIKELFTVEVTEEGVRFGSGLTITDLITQLQKVKSKNSDFAYFEIVADFLKKIGNVQIRNAGTWAGNLMIKHARPYFPSDVFTAMESVGAKVHIYDTNDRSSKVTSLVSFLTDVNITGKLITAIELPKLNNKDRVKMFKVMPRSQNAYACVNAGFRITFDPWKFQILGKPSLVFGGIDATLIHATKTEAFLAGKCLTDGVVLKNALELLKSEINPTNRHVLTSPEYRQNLSVNLFYKFVLELCGKELKTRKNETGSSNLIRPLSSGKQSYDEVGQDEWPLKQGMPKVTSALQASGEASFVNDIPRFTHELAGSLVLTTLGPATIEKIDPSFALTLPGVVEFITAEHIPDKGQNNYYRKEHFDFIPEEIFCSGKVLFAGQPVGIILAETQAQADAAAGKVKISYTDIVHPVLTIEEAVEAERFFDLSIPPLVIGDPEAAFKKAPKTVSGRCSMDPLYHFYLENNVALCVPGEDSMAVYVTSQWSDHVQAAVSQATGKPFNYFEVTIPRIGGGFGGKTSGISHAAAAAAIAAFKTGRPVRCNINLNTNMQFNGLRFPISATYKAGFDESGKIHVVEVEVTVDAGHTTNWVAPHLGEIQSHIDNGYYIPNWSLKFKTVKTDRQGGQPMRSPGSYPASFVIETVVEHVAKSLLKDSTMVKELNLYKEGQTDIGGIVLKNCNLTRMWNELKQSAEIEKRTAAIESFNKVNHWKKRGLVMTPEKYGSYVHTAGFQCLVSVFGLDGTVSVSQGGIEMGQGLYTKVAQAVAHSFQIPIEMVKVKPLSTQISPNQMATGGSTTSEMCVESALRCCEIIKERMAPMREKSPGSQWSTIVQLCNQENINLCAQMKVNPSDHFVSYSIYAVGAAEVELDVLTGENQVLRVDILFDSGESLNPVIDIGQIEGAYVMGLGGYLMEKVIYDPDTGRVLTNGTWEYRPPTTKDIPADFRIKLLSDAPNPLGVRSSKACGEPPIVLSSGVFFALKQAAESARKDNLGNSDFITPEAPFTVERAQRSCAVDINKLVL